MIIQNIKNFLLRRLLTRAQKKLAPSRIPLSRPGSLERDYYSIYFKDREGKYLIFNEVNLDSIKTLRYNENNEGEIVEIKFNNTIDFGFEATYYLSFYEFSSNSIFKFEISNTLRLYILTIIKDKFKQWIYNKRKIAKLDRFKILKYLVEKTIENPDAKFNVLSVIGDIFQYRILYHPNYKQRKKYYDLLFKSLESDGLISSKNQSYEIEPSALTALNNYEQEKRRYSYSIFLQWVLSIITLLSVIGIFLQAYIAYTGK